MNEIGPAHPLSYRHEVVDPVFRAIRAYDSCAVIGPSSMGKSRLLQFVQRPETQQHYLGDADQAPLFVVADANRLAELSEWGLWELLLTALIEACGGSELALPLRPELIRMRSEVITSRNSILARRHMELALHMICQERQLRLCVLLDEFDEIYRILPSLVFANLRALRDMHKYRLCYLIMLREHPVRLRRTQEVEGFYELFERTIVGLGPYQPDDAARVVSQIEARKRSLLTAEGRTLVLSQSGGHPGLILALFDAVARGAITTDNLLDSTVVEQECRKLWGSLADDERDALIQLEHGHTLEAESRAILILKGLVRQQSDGPLALFSPLFARFVQRQAPLATKRLTVDEGSGVVLLDDQPIKDLTAREFDLLTFLYQHLGQIRTREQILERLYPDEVADAQDNRVDTLVKRLREKIEPIRERPRYILTIRGKGYRLVNVPE